MLYFLYKEDKQAWYYETDQEGNVFRQIAKEYDQAIKLSNQRKSLYYMQEHPLDLNDSELLSMQKADFEMEWRACNAGYMSGWEEMKTEHGIGTEVRGHIEVIFPQGIITCLNTTQYPGLIDYEQFAQQAQTSNIYPKAQWRGTIEGYDEWNGWIKIGNARLLDEAEEDL
ncbi:hypothetical protein [Paenibacillus wenxiniae]|uniref:Uncharacterized protein n=1 Tax=Paenibacillus wenxiniae TaxID=1636843 RepID=A0ABW4REA9_9BACL